MPFRAAACTGAMYHVELYVICAELPDLPAGVYHYGAHDNALRQLRHGDFRSVLAAACGSEPSLAQAPLVVVLTSTWWRNAWKYQSRAYRHAFWDSGTVLANLLAVAAGQRQRVGVLVGFADAEVNALIDVDPSEEATVALVSVGQGHPVSDSSPSVGALNLPTRQLSRDQVSYPRIAQAHAESSLPSGAAVAAWRAQFPSAPSEAVWGPGGESIEQVILRRGSSRRFTRESITLDQLHTLVAAATSPTPVDAFIPGDLYLIVNAVEDLAAGTYVLERASGHLVRLSEGEFRREASYLDLGQPLAGDAAFDAYWLVDIDRLDDRGYRAAQLSAAIEGGKLYLAAYALDLGATGLTFFDDDVTRFFSPHAQGKSVMFLTAVGHPARRSAT